MSIPRPFHALVCAFCPDIPATHLLRCNRCWKTTSTLLFWQSIIDTETRPHPPNMPPRFIMKKAATKAKIKRPAKPTSPVLETIEVESIPSVEETTVRNPKGLTLKPTNPKPLCTCARVAPQKRENQRPRHTTQLHWAISLFTPARARWDARLLELLPAAAC